MKGLKIKSSHRARIRGERKTKRVIRPRGAPRVRKSRKNKVGSKPGVFTKKTGKKRASLKKSVSKPKRVISARKRKIARRARGRKIVPSIKGVLVRRVKGVRYRPVVKIKVIGVGGGGGNALTRMSKDPLRGVEFIAVNTDLQDLDSCEAKKKLHIGKTVTRGLGAGMNPELGQQSAEEGREEIEAVLQGADMVFLTAGLGGGTGTGATPVIADIARDMGILTVAVVTKPFSFEGSVRARIAEEGLAKLRDRVDTLLVIPNDRIFNIIDNNTPVLKAFDKIDEILKNSVRGVADMITSSGLVNVDFADVIAVMKDAGIAVAGVGVARGKDRALKAVNEAVNSPLLESSIDGAKGVLFNIAGGRDLKMSEISEAAQLITANVDPAAKIIFGAHYDRKLKRGDLKITLIATGFNGSSQFIREHENFSLFGVGEEGEGVGVAEIKDEDWLPEDEAKARPFEKKKNKEEKTGKKEKSEEEIWEIPAFLRRRKKR